MCMEYMDIVDGNDQVIGSAPIDEIYEKKYLHRIAHIFIFNDKGEVALQLRSKEKSFCPLHWSTSVGGHVQAGESYEVAALRELTEELGITTALEFLGNDFYPTPSGLNKFFGTFSAVHLGPFIVNPQEVERVEFFSLDSITPMIARGEKFNPELVFLLERYFKKARS